jgi:hypothetical protein
MDELHWLAADIARHFLVSHHKSAREDSRLFEDVQQFALEALKTVRSGDRKGAWLPGELRGYWPTSQPVH